MPLYGVRGEFSLSPTVVVPYFACLMDLARATSELKTHEEVSPSLDTFYSLVELYQRQVDFNRVKREIVDGYLRVPNKLKFFNSLTIALLPKSADGKVAQAFEDYPNNDPVVPDPLCGDFDVFFSSAQAGKLRAVFGGVQFISTETENLARLRWDTQRVDAMAVDGQHRLRALKMWMEGKNHQLSDFERPTRVPVLFLLLHERAGFKTTSIQNVGIKSIAREIFTDLNKNAKEVDLATQIILDDLSVEACCVRSLVTPTTCTDDAELLPLSLLRWQEANARFDQKYYLNSIVNLHLIIKDLLGLKSPSPMDKADVIDFIRRVSQQLGTGNEKRELFHDGVSLEKYYLQNYCEEGEDEPIAPFSAIPAHYLPSALEGFKGRYAPWLLKLLREFKPYSDILVYARTAGIIQGEFSQYLSQPESHKVQLQKDLAHKYGEQWYQQVIDCHNSAIEQIKCVGDQERGEDWAFKTIFQKAIVRLANYICNTSPLDARDRLGSIQDYIDFLNGLHSKGVFRVHAELPGSNYGLWVFIAVNYGGRKIKVAASTENRIQALLSLLYYCSRYAKDQGKQISIDAGDDKITVKELLKHLSSNGATASWQKAKDYFEISISTFMGVHATVIASKDLTNDEKAQQRVARQRLEEIVAAALL
jgi:hypothetical protein